jgi:general secretion pathway protein L
MNVPQWLRALPRADFLRSVGLYLTRDRLFLVRLRKDLLRLSFVEEQAREMPFVEDPSRLSSLTGWVVEDVRDVQLREEASSSFKNRLSEAIRSLAPHLRARDSVYVCLSLDQAVQYQVFLPQAVEDNLARVLDYEIERLLPFRREEICYDYVSLGKKGDKVGALLFAAPKKLIQELLETLAAFNIHPRGIETSATALANFVFCAGDFKGPAVVFGGENGSWEVVGLNVAANGWKDKAELLFAHSLPRADWASAPARELVYGISNDTAKLFGWGATEEFVASLGGGPVEVQDLVNLGKDKLKGVNNIDHPESVPAIGAALQGLREATFSVNLLPVSARRDEHKMLSRLNLLLAVLFALGLVAWGASYPLKDEIRLRQLQAENQKIGPEVEVLRRKEEELNRLTREISFLAGHRQRKGEFLQLLDELSRVVPNSAYVSSLRYREGSIELQGNAESASSLVPLLERSPLFKNVGFNAPSNRSRDNRETFSLKAEIERPEERGSQP